MHRMLFAAALLTAAIAAPSFAQDPASPNVQQPAPEQPQLPSAAAGGCPCCKNMATMMGTMPKMPMMPKDRDRTEKPASPN